MGIFRSYMLGNDAHGELPKNLGTNWVYIDVYMYLLYIWLVVSNDL